MKRDVDDDKDDIFISILGTSAASCTKTITNTTTTPSTIYFIFDLTEMWCLAFK